MIEKEPFKSTSTLKATENTVLTKSVLNSQKLKQIKANIDAQKVMVQKNEQGNRPQSKEQDRKGFAIKRTSSGKNKSKSNPAKVREEETQ